MDANPADVATTDVGPPDGGPPGAGFVFGVVSGAVVEGGSDAQFSVHLATAPTASVVLPIRTTDPRVLAMPSSLNFDASNWWLPQNVSVVAILDSIDRGDASYTVQFGAIVSSDAAYAALSPTGPTIAVTDDDVASVAATLLPHRMCDRAGTSMTAEVAFVLTSEPTAAVTISLPATSRFAWAAPSITFTTSTWNTPQNVAVTYTGGDLTTHTEFNLAVGAISSGDVTYAALVSPTLPVTVCDAGDTGVLVQALDGTALERVDVNPVGLDAPFQVVLAAAPTAPVTLTFATSDPSVAAIGGTQTLTFDATNWSTPQGLAVIANEVSQLTVDTPFELWFVGAESEDVRYAAAMVDPVPGLYMAVDDLASGISLSFRYCGELINATALRCSDLTCAVESLTDSNSSSTCRLAEAAYVATEPIAVTITLSAVQDIIGVLVDCNPATPAPLEVSVDGTAWTTIPYVDGVPTAVSFSARYARLRGTLNGQGPFGNSVECSTLELYSYVP